MSFFNRLIEPTLKETAKTFPVTVLTGPRQSGKTTLLRQLFPNYQYINLEEPDTLLAVKEDPRGFLRQYPDFCIIDEAQLCPELFSYLQVYLDLSPQKRHFILSGSQNFLLANKISQSLAGRAAILELLPLSYIEYCSDPNMQSLSLWEFLALGSYPRPYHESLALKLWYEGYIRTYLERDIRSLIQVKDLVRFQLFLKLCAGRHGQLLNMNALASDAGISHTTAAHWLNLLEASYIVYRLPPYFKNFNKRLVKTPKLYFYDSGIVCLLLGIDSPSYLQAHAHRGAIFEGYVLAEIYKFSLAMGQRPALYFWRDHIGMEIDALLMHGDKCLSLEIKSGETINADYFNHLKQWEKIPTDFKKEAFVVYSGESSAKRGNISILPWNKINTLFSVYNPN